jgi:hypothetical protein
LQLLFLRVTVYGDQTGWKFGVGLALLKEGIGGFNLFRGDVRLMNGIEGLTDVFDIDSV